MILGAVSAAADAALIFLSYLLAVRLRFTVLDGSVSIPMDSPFLLSLIAGYAVLAVMVYAGFHLYHPNRLRRLWKDISVVTLVNTLGVLALMALLFTLRIIDFSRGTVILFWGISSLLVILKTALVRSLRKAWIRQERFLTHVVVVGSGKNAGNYIREIAERPELGIRVDGYLSRETGNKETRDKIENCLGCYAEIREILEAGKVDEIVVALEPDEISWMPEILKAAEREGLRMEMIPMYSEYYPTHPTIESIGETKLVNLRATPLDNIALAAIKRTGDILISLILLILLSPLMLGIAIGVKLSSPGPVLFKQERIGKDKKPFVMLKFRSMRTGIDHSGWSTDRDPRKTKFGSLIRKLSLDELPQLWNVLTGSMSLVGPRPEIPKYVRQFKEEVPLYLIRQQVRPGMTGWAQVNGLRGDTSIEDRVTYDIWYIQNWSLALDVKILLRTVFGGMMNSEKIR